MSARVDVVIVSFQSRSHLRACVEPLLERPGVAVTVVDNASTDGSLEAVEDLPVRTIALDRNGGFAHGCNVGWHAGEAPFVLLLNPDATIDRASLERLVEVFEASPRAGAVAPQIRDGHGSLELSLRRFPRIRSTYAQALFLHRLFPKASWTDELIRDEAVYRSPGAHEWVSGACILLRRSCLEELGGLDEGFFMYCEDIDLCRRLRQAGYEVLYEPAAIAVHAGGASAPRPSLLPVLAASRLRYANKHRRPLAATLERMGIALSALTHMALGRGGRSARAGHARSLLLAFGPAPRIYPSG